MTKFAVNFGVFSIEKEWKPQDEELDAAWELYVELATRVVTVQLPEKAVFREALSSIHSIFETTRIILRKFGSKIAPKLDADNIGLGHIAVILLNEILRPFLSKWHPLLEYYENQNKERLSPLEHQSSWDKKDEFREELNTLQVRSKEFAKQLELVIGVSSLLDTDQYVDQT